MKSAIISTIAIALVATAPTNPQTNGTGIDKTKIYIKSIGYAGTGCPAGSVSSNLNSDSTAITLLFDSYVISAGPGIAVTEMRKNCQMNVDLRVPGGWQYSVGTVDYRGFYSLDAGVIGVQSSTYYFQGQTVQGRRSVNYSGPKSGDYTIRDDFPMESLVWSPCGANANININSAIALRGASSAPGGKSGLMTTDSVDLKVVQQYALKFKRC